MADENLPPQPVKDRRRVPRWAIAIVVIVAAIGVLLSGIHLYYYIRIRAEIVAIRMAGFPVTLEELDAWYPTPKGENAANVLNEAFASFVLPPASPDLPIVGEAKLPPRGQPMPDDQFKAVAQYLADNAKALALIHKGAAIKECRFSRDFKQGLATSLPHLAALRHANRLLMLEALVKAQRGDAQGATDSFCASPGVVHSLAKEPLVISQLVRIALVEMTVGTLERCAATTTFTEAQLAELSAALQEEEREIDSGFVRGFVGERCMELDVFNRPAQIADAIKSFGFKQRTITVPLIGIRVSIPRWWFGMRVTGVLAADKLDYLRRMREAIETSQRPFPQKLDEANASWAAYESGQETMGFVTGFLVSPLAAHADEQQARALARLRAVRVALAMERYRMANGKMPTSVEELVPKYLDSIPQDPYDGNPIRFRTLTKGFVAYSVGMDRKDDGGKEWDQGTASGDVTFTIER